MINHKVQLLSVELGDDLLDSGDAARAVILLILILLSAFFSGAQKAFNSINKLRLRGLADDDVKGARYALALLEKPAKLHTALLICIYTANFSAAALTTASVIKIIGNEWVGLATGILILIMLLFVETAQKSVSSVKAEKNALRVAGLILLFTKLLTPLIFIIHKLCGGVLKLFGIDFDEKPDSTADNELRTILEASHEDGVLESEERKMIANVVDFKDSLVKDVMVPRIDMAFASADLTYDELVEVFAADKYTRLPVYAENRDNVIGIVNLKDLFFYNGSKEDFNITDIMREPYFTYEFKKTSELLIEMRRESIALAIVLDEYGATAGLVTIEDLLEEIVGEIRDEYDDDEEDCIKAISDNEYIVDGNTKLDEINEALGLNIESDDYDSIAGHIIYLLDHLPEEGEAVTDNNVVYTVSAVDKNRIDKVHILIKKEVPESESKD